MSVFIAIIKEKTLSIMISYRYQKAVMEREEQKYTG